MNLDAFQIAILAVLQGLTEFLPISSSAHLVLPSIFFGWDDQGLTFDVAVHVGTLVAVLIYFRQDLTKLTLAWFRSLGSGNSSDESKLAWLLILATVPAGLAGILLGDFIEQYARSANVIATGSIAFALLLWWSARFSRGHASLNSLTWKTALFIGCAQMLALIPGTSRSGVTMTAALFCHLNAKEASKFSFLLSIPIILASGLLKSVELSNNPESTVALLPLLLAMSLAGVVAYCCIHFFLQLIERIGFLPFVIYRILMGLLLLAFYL